nr:dTDP-4-dehydrorhamnose reductase [Ramlibacter aurantiacus]
MLGASGQVGWELQRSLAPLGELVMPARTAPGNPVADLERPDTLLPLVRQVGPQVIVNAAAYTAVDRAESDAEAAHRVNALAPGELARAARECGALLVHYSTDYVFDGSGSRPWRETDATGPLNAYGRTKLDGERRIAAEWDRHLILRTSWVYGTRGGNFMKTMLRLAAERERLRVVDDQVGAPTGADLLADLTAHAIRATLADPARAGLYHAAAAGETSWNGYARLVLDAALGLGLALRARPDGVEPVTSDAFPTPARRPLNSRLDTSRLRDAFDLAPPPWQHGVLRALAELVPPESSPA